MTLGASHVSQVPESGWPLPPRNGQRLCGGVWGEKVQCPDKELRSQGYRPESPAFLAV